MDVKVRFRFNKITGEIEIFDVEDEGTMRLPEAEHNREHDRIAANVGQVIEQNAQVRELLPDQGAPGGYEPVAQPEPVLQPENPEPRIRRRKQVE